MVILWKQKARFVHAQGSGMADCLRHWTQDVELTGSDPSLGHQVLSSVGLCCFLSHRKFCFLCPQSSVIWKEHVLVLLMSSDVFCRAVFSLSTVNSVFFVHKKFCFLVRKEHVLALLKSNTVICRTVFFVHRKFFYLFVHRKFCCLKRTCSCLTDVEHVIHRTPFSLSTETTQWAKPSWCDIWVPVTRSLSTMIPTVKQMTTFWENDLASNSRSVRSSTVGRHIESLGVCRHELDAIQDFSVLTQPKFWAWKKKRKKKRIWY